MAAVALPAVGGTSFLVRAADEVAGPAVATVPAADDVVDHGAVTDADAPDPAACGDDGPGGFVAGDHASVGRRAFTCPCGSCTRGRCSRCRCRRCPMLRPG